ncbi:DHA2 family efflux MFS transporter permease subunit [Paeniglutamicibacter gangotriensis]|uniref:EmrB/QacA subfamily drug resistance transporter n=1 Tax=Paeniglutamicibacter gangotriensis Lz1y TaxID=1276920 RepID=M7MUL9_9MICC|nr:DHA2 family efflux MFS transporter permease subunit [Paeniglutamicibacter gangotriensis]EMR00143.1 EmrB/QacA subfamily drug resistance transporter [Paeniglutamicibacter gangotriensis Lz1y]
MKNSEDTEPEEVDLPHKWSALWVLAIGLGMIILDGTIVGVALPTIITSLDLDLTEAQWINSIYSVVFAALLLSAGRIGDRLGRKRLFITGTSIFVIGSILAALSGSSTLLLLARVVQGIGGAMVLPATLSTVNAVFRGKDRAAAFGVWGATMSGAAAVGPLLGGWLAGSFSWEWIFWVNVPIGLAVIVATVLLVPETKGKVTTRGLDVDGFQLSALGIGAVVFAIIEGPSMGWWAPTRDATILFWTWPQTAFLSPVPVIGLLGLVAIAVFLLWERHRARVQRSALLDLSLFSLPRFSWGNATAAMVAVGEFALIFVLPLYLVSARGLGVMQAGFVLAAMAVGAFLAGAQARHLAARIGPPAVVLLGLGLEVVGIAVMAFLLAPTVSVWLMTIPLVIYGLGLGLASAQLTSLVLADVSTSQSGQGSATQSTVRQVGMAIGTAVAGALLSMGLGFYLSTGTPLDEATRVSAGGALQSLRAQGGQEDLVAELSGQFAQATQMTLLGAVAFLVMGLLGAWIMLRLSKRSEQAH